jgi:hypothetical protein
MMTSTVLPPLKKEALKNKPSAGNLRLQHAVWKL